MQSKGANVTDKYKNCGMFSKISQSDLIAYILLEETVYFWSKSICLLSYVIFVLNIFGVSLLLSFVFKVHYIQKIKKTIWTCDCSQEKYNIFNYY